MEERGGVITFKGNPMTLIGPGLRAGDKAPDSELGPVGLWVFEAVPTR